MPNEETSTGLEQQRVPVNIQGVNIINAETLMPAGMREILEHILSQHQGIVWTIAFLEDMEPNAEGKKLFSAFYYKSRTMAINLTQHFEDMNVRVGKNECAMRGDIFVWYNLLISVFHEIYHGKQFIDKGIKVHLLEKEEQDKACKEAQTWAIEAVNELAKTVPIEPPALENWGFLSEELVDFRATMEEFVEAGDPPEFASEQAQMFKDSTAVKDNETDIATLRQYCELKAADDDPQWEIELITVIKPEEKTEETDTNTPEINTLPDGPDVYETETLPEGSEEGLAALPVTADLSLLDQPIIMVAGPPNGAAGQVAVSMAEIEKCAYTVNRRLASQIYHKCQFTQGSYINPFGILEWVPISDVANAREVFQKMDCLDDNGKLIKDVPIWEDDPRLPNKVNGCIKGRTFAENKLPGYCLYLSVGGALHRRTILPQNPNKMNGVNLSTWAQKARNGHFIILVYKDLNDTEKAANASGIVAKLEVAPGQTLEYLADPFDNTKRRVLSY